MSKLVNSFNLHLPLSRWLPILLVCAGSLADIACSAPLHKHVVASGPQKVAAGDGSGEAHGAVPPLGQDAPPPQNNPPPADQPISLWQHLKRGDPPAYSAVAAIAAVICSLLAALSTLCLAYLIRRGQIAQEQVKMVLDIDSELIKSPELWVVHGPKYIPISASTDAVTALLTKVTENTKEADKAATAALEAHKKQPIAPQASGSTGRTSQQLKELALVARYFNMFDFIYSAIGRSRRIPWTRRDEWKAWKNYMRDFFNGNEMALNAWNEFNQSKLYTESFKRFVENEILNKSPE